MGKKFELTTDTKIHFGRKLFRIKALISFGNVNAGDLGGYVESEKNLSQSGDAWVYGDAEVCGDAWVYGNARVCGDAWVYGNARVYGDAWVYGNARVYGDAWVYGDAEVYGDAWVYGNARVYGDAEVCGNAEVCGDADYVCVKGLGSQFRNTTFFKCKNGDIYVICGCFEGNLDEFTKKVKTTHGDSKYAKEYLAMVEVVKIHFENENGNESGEQSD